MPKINRDLGSIFLLAIFVVFLLGSAIHFYDTAISGVNIISVFLLPIILFSMVLKKYTVAGWLAFLGLGLLLFFSLTAVFIEPESGNFRLLRGALVSSAAVWGTAWLVKHHQQLVPRVLSSTLAICFLIAILQISYLMNGFGLDPTTHFSTEEFYVDNKQLMGAPSIFGNPNDFSVFACLIFLYFLFSSKKRLNIPIVVSLFCILISGSKTTVIIAILGFVTGGKHLNIKFAALLVFFVSCLIFYLLKGNFEGSGVYVVDRTFFTIIEVFSGSLDNQSSASIRYESWAYFFREYSGFMFGTFSAGKVFPQFLSAPFDTSVISLNPHSFIIELHALFGFGGLLISGALFLAVYKSMSRFYAGWAFVYAFCSILLLVNVSSSILGSGSTYALIALLSMSPVSRASVVNLSGKFHN